MQCTVCLLGEGTVRDTHEMSSVLARPFTRMPVDSANERDTKTRKERLQGTELFIVVG